MMHGHFIIDVEFVLSRETYFTSGSESSVIRIKSMDKSSIYLS